MFGKKQYTWIHPEHQQQLSSVVQDMLASRELPAGKALTFRPYRQLYHFKRGGHEYIAKTYLPRRWWFLLLNLFRKQESRNSFEKARYLHDHNIGTAQTLAYVDQQYVVFGIRISYWSCIIQKYETSIESGLSYILYGELDNAATRHIILQRSAAMIASFHDLNLYHQDLSLRNMMVDRSQARLMLFDLDRCACLKRWPVWLRQHIQMNDLRRLNHSAFRHLSISDRLRWFAYYTQARQFSRQSKRCFMKWLDYFQVREVKRLMKRYDLSMTQRIPRPKP